MVEVEVTSPHKPPDHRALTSNAPLLLHLLLLPIFFLLLLIFVFFMCSCTAGAQVVSHLRALLAPDQRVYDCARALHAEQVRGVSCQGVRTAAGLALRVEEGPFTLARARVIRPQPPPPHPPRARACLKPFAPPQVAAHGPGVHEAALAHFQSEAFQGTCAARYRAFKAAVGARRRVDKEAGRPVFKGEGVFVDEGSGGGAGGGGGDVEDGVEDGGEGAADVFGSSGRCVLSKGTAEERSTR